MFESSRSPEIERLKKECFGLSMSEKAERGRLLKASIKERLIADGFTKQEADRFLFDLVAVAVSADRFAANEEYDLFAAIFGKSYSYMDFFELTDGGASDSFVGKVDYVVDHSSALTKHKCVEFTFLFLSSDYSIRKEEERVILLLLKDS